jgi:hypothetical protein
LALACVTAIKRECLFINRDTAKGIENHIATAQVKVNA